MFVKRLEMHGFKSFADKTTFSLTPGITVIVGPNGCGKSNITDAIRWVLGEQSARHLRGMRMDDIIFNGSANRKALSFAEVSVTFDHSDGALGLDYQEITVTRRIYRSGESEYMLNKRACRLKDILELFMDSGVGKEAYSIIGQGRVDEIINAKPEERRQIFEEAAGILKYKNRKREAQRRLAETAENLLRVGDIISELAQQLDPLSKMAEQAQSYLDYREQLKKQEVDVLVCDAQDLREKWYETDTKVKSISDELLEHQKLLNRKEAELAQSQMQLDEEQSSASEKQRQMQHIATELEKLQGKIAVNEEKMKNIDRQLEEGEAYFREQTEQEVQIKTESKRITEKITSVSAAVARAKEDLQAAEAELSGMENSEEARHSQSVQDKLEKLLPKIRKLQSEHDRLTLEEEQLAEIISSVKKQQKQKQQERAELQAELQTLQTKIEQYNKEKDKLLSKIEHKEKETETLISQTERLETRIQQKQKELMQYQNQLQINQELEAAMAGYYQGVKTILTAGKNGIFGTVADIITVPPRYVAAVEAALGTGLQNLVTENEDVAKDAIDYLKKVKGGRATFLPLGVVEAQKRRPHPQELAQLDGYIGIAADLVETRDQFKPVIESLLSRIHIVQNMDTALAAARVLRFRERIVTVDGDVIMPGGAMSGGFDKKQKGGVLTRRKETAALQKTMEENQEKLKMLQQELKDLVNRQSLAAAESNDHRDKLRQLELKLGLVEQELSYVNKQTDIVQKEEKAIADNLLAVKERQNEHRIKLTDIDQQHTSILQQESNLRVEMARLSGLLSAREQEKRSLQEQYTECRVRLASYEQQLEYHQDELERSRRENRQLAERRKLKEEEVSHAEKIRVEIGELLEADRVNIQELKRQQHLQVKELQEIDNSLKLHTTQFREETEQLRQLEKSLHTTERKQTRLEMERERLEADMQAILDRLRESWELEFAEAEKEANPVPDKKAAHEEIRRLKAQIQALGTVNLGAIDEYQRVTERVEFLSLQRDDLQEGEKDLLKIIEEIDSRMSEKFASSFRIINDSFSSIFKELFGGGRAQLRLTDPNSPLEAGVEIVAQPPGKKLQHMSLLSGGEKALTAIALLFAFLQVRPTPFCILDEIEAALDDANLARFCNYLRTYAEQTQFILISHRKKTMEQADILYGVTMEESGVSKLISVRLKENIDPVASA